VLSDTAYRRVADQAEDHAELLRMLGRAGRRIGHRQVEPNETHR
jgi:hypothetical protein